MAAGTTDRSTSARRSAGERREDVVVEAIRRFARSGYCAASTEAIARDAGISQPCRSRLLGRKRDLFLACHDRCMDRVRITFRDAARDAPPAQKLSAMGHAYIELLRDRSLLLFQMQSYAASADPEIQAHVRAHYGELVKEVTGLSGGQPHEVWTFFAHGMLLNVVASLDLSAIAEEDEWAAAWTDPGPLIAPEA